MLLKEKGTHEQGKTRHQWSKAALFVPLKRPHALYQIEAKCLKIQVCDLTRSTK